MLQCYSTNHELQISQFLYVAVSQFSPQASETLAVGPTLGARSFAYVQNTRQGMTKGGCNS
jgi:hypothetical protein